MRPYKIFQAATLAACLLAGLSGCGGNSASGPEALAEPPRVEAVTPTGDHSTDAAPEASSADAAPKALRADRPSGTGRESGAPSAFPGEADLLPALKAVTDFCDRPGSLAFMTRDGCRAALSRLSRDVDGHIYFNSLEDCRNFLRERRNNYNDIVDEHRAWCRNTFANLHDRRGCIDAATVFLDSFTEREFCRSAPSAQSAPGKNAQASQRFAAPALENYNEPGRKFDQPRRGRLPAAPAPAQAASPSAPPSAASVNKSVSAPSPVEAKSASGQAAAPVVPAAPKPAEQTPAEASPPAPVVPPAITAPAAPSVPASGEAVPPAIPAPSVEAAPVAPPAPAVPLIPPAATAGASGGAPAPSVPAAPAALPGEVPSVSAPAAPSAPASSEAAPPAAPVPSGEAAPAAPPAPTVPLIPSVVETEGASGGAPAPSAPVAPAGQLAPPAPAGVPAWPAATDFSNVPEPPAGQSLGATTGPNAVSPEAVPEAIRATSGGQVESGQTTPEQPASDAPDYELPAPDIGKKEPVVPLPPVPTIGQIAPPLVPGVPPDTAISESTLPAPESAAPQTGFTPAGFPTPPNPTDAFGAAIPNFTPLPPIEEEQPRAMPLSGAPAGQAGN